MSSWLLALTLVEQLREAGATDVVLAPGSRNAPLAIALDRAARAGELTLHVRIDERSAGFLALGLAKSTGRPVAVVTTSGTAVGNLLPAVMEANHSGVPLVVCSADRPETMINSGANQTTDQLGLFAHQVRSSHRLSSGGDISAWRFQLRRTLTTATGLRTRRPGPVHVNLALATPLMPSDEALPQGRALVVEPPVAFAPVQLSGEPHTVVLVGDASPQTGERARLVAEAARVPLLAEPSSNARTGAMAISTYRLLLGKPDLGGRIERVVLFGHPTLSRPVTALLGRDDLELVVVAEHADWVDPGFRVARVVDDVELAPGDPHWTNRWLTADENMRARIDLARRPGVGEEAALTADRVAELVVDRTGGGVLVLGSSNLVRDADLAPVVEPAPRVFANRGLAGIDGTIATAIGIHHGLGEPVTVLLGDLTALHDVGSLWLGSLEARPLVRVVVVDDRGGSIFHTLEQGAPEWADSFERVFGTPHQVDLVQVATGYGWQAVEVTEMDELGARLRVPVRGPELLLVRAPRDGRRAWSETLASF